MSSSREMGQRPQGSTGAGAFVPTYHREMLMDRKRVRAFQKAITYYGGSGRSFMEFGPGTGVMAAHAASVFDRVFVVERDETMLEVCRENMRRLGLLDKKVTVIHGDVLEADLPRVDVIMAELLSTLMIHEPEVPAMNRARTLLNPGGALIPGRVLSLATLAWSKFDTQGIEFRSPYTLFTGVSQPEIASESRLFFTADFLRAEVPMHVESKIEMDCLCNGEVNSLVLQSISDLAPSVTFSASDSLNPPMVVPITPVRVDAGRRVRVHLAYDHFSDWHTFQAHVEV